MFRQLLAISLAPMTALALSRAAASALSWPGEKLLDEAAGLAHGVRSARPDIELDEAALMNARWLVL